MIDEANAATTKEQALAIYAKATPAVDEIRASVQAYKDLAALYAQCEDWVSEYGSDVAAVSYTHLDVYKRQHSV